MHEPKAKERATTSQPRYSANLPGIGISTFFRSPICEDLSSIDADVGILGIPYDAGVAYRPGTRFGPREIRTHSVRYGSWGGSLTAGYFDINTRERRMEGISLVDCGDVDVAYYDIERNLGRIESDVAAILSSGTFPVLVGGDHSVSYPCVRAFKELGPIDIVHFDAHLDWVDEIDGIRYGNGSPMRRISELPFVRNMVHIGIRDVRSRETDYRAALDRGALIVTRQELREIGVAGVLEKLPELGNVYVSLDIDGLDPAIAPGTGTPTADGMQYHELRGLFQGVAERGHIAGFDLVEVNPYLDNHGQTSLLAATLILECLGAVFNTSAVK